jgi:hypothetical protein
MINIDKRNANRNTLHGLAKDFAVITINKNASGTDPEQICKVE